MSSGPVEEQGRAEARDQEERGGRSRAGLCLEDPELGDEAGEGGEGAEASDAQKGTQPVRGAPPFDPAQQAAEPCGSEDVDRGERNARPRR